MAASVLFACGLNESKLPAFVHISEESTVDGSFIISSILGQRLRISNAGTLLVCLQHNYQHYFHAGMRLGYNCNLFLNKTLGVIDPLTDMAKDFLHTDWLRSNNTDICDLLLRNICDQIYIGNTFLSRINNTIIVDNLMVLYNLGASREQVLRLCHGLAQITKDLNNLTVVTKLSNCDLYGAEDMNLAQLSMVYIKVLKLKSGIFKEVDGKLLIKHYWNGENDQNTLEQINGEYNSKEVLYKINDRNIKIFNPGEIGLKA